MNFRLNNITWTIIFVNPHSNALIDRTGKRTLATTSPVEKCIYISKDLRYEDFERVVKHELTHAVMISYDLLRVLYSLSSMVDVEEFICNIVAEYDNQINDIFSQILHSTKWR